MDVSGTGTRTAVGLRYPQQTLRFGQRRFWVTGKEMRRLSGNCAGMAGEFS
jgi:hypothetical protein